MKNAAIDFKKQVTVKLADVKLQGALARLQSRFVEGRAAVIGEIDDLQETRTAAAAIRDRVLNNLEQWLLQFEQQATARGAIVHWAESGADVNRIVVEIAALHGVKTAAKSKSMVSEECGLNDALELAGVAVMETDLGEYILQLAHEAPSHIVAPVVHKNKEEIADLFAEKHHLPRKTDIAELCREAREVLRPAFLNADMGISGGNFLLAETGSVLIVTNEGNGRLVTTLPRVHVAVSGIEKIVPTLEDVTTLLRLLPRSATGQSITNYVSVLTGNKNAEDHDGPEHFHIILLDNGRSSLVGSEMQEMLRCIRCGACMNHCPVYQNIGGHAYGWVAAAGRPGKRARPAQCIDPVRRLRGGMPGQDSVAGFAAQAARKTDGPRHEVAPGNFHAQGLGMAGAAPRHLCAGDKNRRAHHADLGRQRKADTHTARCRRLDGWPGFPGTVGADFP
jgi:L-lactate dehydrogenase complex protein LldF